MQKGVIKVAKDENIPKNARDFDELFDESVQVGLDDISPSVARHNSIDLEYYIEKSKWHFYYSF